MCFISKGIPSRKTIAPYCNTSPDDLLYTHVPRNSEKRFSACRRAAFKYTKAQLKTLIPKGNNRPSIWINANSGYEREQKEIKGAFMAIPKPTLTLTSSNSLKRLRLYLIFSFKLPSYYQCLNMRKPQGERSNSGEGWGKSSAPKRSIPVQGRLRAADNFWQLNLSEGGTNGNRHDIARCLRKP